MIELRAAELGIEPHYLEVNVATRSDKRAMLGAEDLPAGPLEAKMEVRLSASGLNRAEIEDLVQWVVVRSPVADGLCRAVPMKVALVVA